MKTAISGGPVVTLGNFDGLHLGHRKILSKIVKRAHSLGVPSVVYTFVPHPLKIVAPDKSPPLITTPEEKAELISELGIDFLVLARFTKGFAAKHPREFIEDVLWKGLRPREVWVGHDYAFGKGKQGTTGYLEKLGAELGFKTGVVAAHKKSGAVISSSRIRVLIKQGQVKEAAELLGREFSLTGCVVKGRGAGLPLGFPTANLKTRNELIPKDGVYAAVVELKSKLYPAVVNIGPAPTFKRRKKIVEVHILDFTATIYDKNIKVFFIKKIRDVQKFATTGELAEQIARDVKKARRALGAKPIKERGQGKT